MRFLIAALWLVSQLAAGSAFAQAAPPNEAGVTMGHWHLNSRDVEANKKLFVALGGIAAKPGAFELVKFPGVVVFLHLRAGSAAGDRRHRGHRDQPRRLPGAERGGGRRQVEGRGPDMQPGGNGRTDQAWITTADGLKVEILEDKTQTVPIRHHHIHYYLAEAAIPEIQAWYVKHFGAKAGMRGRNQSADIPGANLTFTKTDTPTVPTLGRVLDHIGFDVKNLEEFGKKLDAAGIKLDRPLVAQPGGGKLTFIHDPWGTSIELNERPNPL